MIAIECVDVGGSAGTGVVVDEVDGAAGVMAAAEAAAAFGGLDGANGSNDIVEHKKERQSNSRGMKDDGLLHPSTRQNRLTSSAHATCMAHMARSQPTAGKSH